MCQASKQRRWWYRRLVVLVSELFHPIVWLVWQAYSDKAEFCFCFFLLKTVFCVGAPLNEYKTDVWFVRYNTRVRSLVRDGINRAGPLLPRYTIFRLRENISQRLKRILSNFNIVACPNFFFYGFRNVTNVRDNRKTSSRYLSPLNRPVSPVIANLVMKDAEQRALASSPIQRFFWKKYVDDSFLRYP